MTRSQIVEEIRSEPNMSAAVLDDDWPDGAIFVVRPRGIQ